ncbi:DUF6407 family protein [Jeotgalibacillus haloalkalitolerans]|uniref:DUF6407 family protein n=1 Tax=Jeotgalibacillus haloalkalitolerans TaxID=3104292 RepID=A0ABU5KPL2_9BACL|nr:DUF6407 family protein [Jeotgalibacillus sp. HH7-29]MDZ5712650.1 DUF6407 family protein [Jeotgalibacillus sp. HH7-29]
MNFEDFAEKYWNGDLYSYITEALKVYQMNSSIENEESASHLYLSSIAEENMLTRLVEATGEYEHIEAAFDGRVVRDY